MMLFAHGTDSIGLASIDSWRSLLKRARKQGLFVGVDERAYPRDFATFARYHSQLRKLSDQKLAPEPLTLAELESFIDRAAPHDRVRWLNEAEIAISSASKEESHGRTSRVETPHCT